MSAKHEFPSTEPQDLVVGLLGQYARTLKDVLIVPAGSSRFLSKSFNNNEANWKQRRYMRSLHFLLINAFTLLISYHFVVDGLSKYFEKYLGDRSDPIRKLIDQLTSAAADMNILEAVLVLAPAVALVYVHAYLIYGIFYIWQKIPEVQPVVTLINYLWSAIFISLAAIVTVISELNTFEIIFNGYVIGWILLLLFVCFLLWANVRICLLSKEVLHVNPFCFAAVAIVGLIIEATALRLVWIWNVAPSS